jgi:UDP-glucose 4-epimerase
MHRLGRGEGGGERDESTRCELARVDLNLRSSPYEGILYLQLRSSEITVDWRRMPIIKYVPVVTDSPVRYLISGGAGFIGSHLVDSLLAQQRTKEVRILDNFSSGRRKHLSHHSNNPKLKVHVVNLLELAALLPLFDGIDIVFHLAANPDARCGIQNTRLDLEQETIATYNVLEAMRMAETSRIVLSSSGTVYGDVGTNVTNEGMGPCLPISLYGAGKVAAEALVSAFCGTFGMRGVILRFGNIIGERTTHGVIFDFIRALSRNPDQLPVLGNGDQAKPYVYVRDLVEALMFASQKCLGFERAQFDVFNVAPDGATSVRFIANQLLDELGLTGRTAISYGFSAAGWPGDVAQSRMDSSKLRAAGYQLQRSSDQAVQIGIGRIVEWLAGEPEDPDGLRLPANADLRFKHRDEAKVAQTRQLVSAVK